MAEMHDARNQAANAKARVTSRRHFLSRTAITAAMTAAIIGGAEVIGLNSASANDRRLTNRKVVDTPAGQEEPDCTCVKSYTCFYSPRSCNGGRPCSSGHCCYYCPGIYVFVCLSGCPAEQSYCTLQAC